MIKVGINGYGTIGRRVAQAIMLQKDMTVTGIVKTKPDYVARFASHNFKLFSPDDESRKQLEEGGLRVSGTLENLIDDSDIIVDATPEGVGAKNLPAYKKAGIKATFQGGEEPSVAEASFNAYANFEESTGKNYVRVVSCNTTGLARTLSSIKSAYGIKHVNATLIRRATDPNDSRKGPINAVEPGLKFPSHHAPDLRTVLGDVDIDTVAVKVPTTLMHVHVIQVDLSKETSAEQVLENFLRYQRILVVSGKDGLTSTAQIMDFARERSRNRSDLYEVAVWRESVNLKGMKLNYIQAVHQESDVVPENVDAIRAMFETMDREKSLSATDMTLNIGNKVF
ncbi:MAG: type II glyceraldehyde-3-phosphate dehydrogenase [Candidatus Thermoplasmatota archaeon]|nr:type II glyceraldehyde-3-phosphate dehydrogenase [Candidatus Thermoplasmatota archaeon]